MVCEINFPARFVLDEFFIKDILKDKVNASKILMKLSYIHSNSKQYRMIHNRMFDECFKNSIKDKQIRGYALLGVMSPEPFPSFVQNETDIESKIVRYAINLATKKPYTTIILTSEEQSKKYIENKHYMNGNVKSSVLVVFGEIASKVIDIVANHKE